MLSQTNNSSGRLLVPPFITVFLIPMTYRRTRSDIEFTKELAELKEASREFNLGRGGLRAVRQVSNAASVRLTSLSLVL